MNITLIGFMGTGKTAVGRLLAKRLKRRFIDIDQLIEAREERSIARIFAESGEPYFRRVERTIIARTLRQPHLVVAAGGGAVLHPDNLRAFKRSGPVIGLSASVKTLLERLGRAQGRPLLATPDRRRRVVQLLHRRRPAYAQADMTIDTTHRSVRQVVRLIERYLSHTSWPPTAFGRTMQVWDLPASFCKHAKLLSRRYPGRYVAIVDDHVVAVGRNRCDVYRQTARQLPAQKEIGVVYLPHRDELTNVSPLWTGRIKENEGQ